MKSSASKIHLTGFNDLFQTDGEAEVSGEQVQEGSFVRLVPFQRSSIPGAG